MGEAKSRGTFEERYSQALYRRAEEERLLAQQHALQRAIRPRGKPSAALLLAGLLAIAGSGMADGLDHSLRTGGPDSGRAWRRR